MVQESRHFLVWFPDYLLPSYGQVFIDDEDISLMKSHEVAKKLAILKQTNQHQVRISIRDLSSFWQDFLRSGRLEKKKIFKKSIK